MSPDPPDSRTSAEEEGAEQVMQPPVPQPVYEPHRFLLVALERTVVALAHPWRAMKVCGAYSQPRLVLLHIHTRIFPPHDEDGFYFPDTQHLTRLPASIPISPSSHRSLCCTLTLFVSFQTRTRRSSVVPTSHGDTVSDESEFQMRPIWRFIFKTPSFVFMSPARACAESSSRLILSQRSVCSSFYLCRL